jgi:hypothetical protein
MSASRTRGFGIIAPLRPESYRRVLDCLPSGCTGAWPKTGVPIGWLLCEGDPAMGPTEAQPSADENSYAVAGFLVRA